MDDRMLTMSTVVGPFVPRFGAIAIESPGNLQPEALKTIVWKSSNWVTLLHAYSTTSWQSGIGINLSLNRGFHTSDSTTLLCFSKIMKAASFEYAEMLPKHWWRIGLDFKHRKFYSPIQYEPSNFRDIQELGRYPKRFKAHCLDS